MADNRTLKAISNSKQIVQIDRNAEAGRTIMFAADFIQTGGKDTATSLPWN